MNAQPPQALQEQKEEKEINLKHYWTMFKRRCWLIFLPCLVVVGSTAVYLEGMPRQYEATAVLKLSNLSGGSSRLSSALGSFLRIGSASDVATEIQTIKGRNIAERVIGELGLDKKERYLGLERRRMIPALQGMLKVEQRRGAYLIDITATSYSPQEARDIANEVADEYVQLCKAFSQEAWEDLMGKVEVKLKKTEDDLENSRQSLYNHEAEAGITTAFSPLLMGGTQYMIPEVPQAVGNLKASLIQMEIQLETMREGLPEADPAMISLKSQIAATRKKLEMEERKAIEKYDKQFGLTRSAAEVAFNQQLYSSLVSKQVDLSAQYIMQNKPPEIIETAIEPLYPSKPKKKLILMLSAVAGLFLGLGAAFLRELLDNSIHTAQDVTGLLDLPVLANIPRLKHAKRNPGTDALISYYDGNTFRNKRARELYRESYRMFLLEVIVATEDFARKESNTQHRGGLALLVTSSVSEEGESIVAANLAICIAQTGKKVLLVDADYRNSVQHELLDLDAQVGLMDILAGNTAWNDAVNSTAIDNLWVVTSGDGVSQPDPSALFISPRLQDFIKSAKEQFDVIIFDSPRATAVSEPAVISSKIDGVVLVIKANNTRRNNILQAKQRIQNSGGNVLGAVLNCVTVGRRLL